MTKQWVSACVMTFNEEQNIERCLDSVQWCDEIVVLDSFSTDRTVELCRRYTAHVHQGEWRGYIDQRNELRKLAQYPWVLFLDADEEVSLELRKKIQRELEKPDAHYVGFRFPRKVLYLNRWIAHGEWYPDIKLRLFQKERGRSVGVEPHDQVVVDGPVKTLRAPLYHYTYRDIAHHVDTMNRFSSISARAKHDASMRFRWIDFMFRPFLRFVRGYFIKLGFLDGRRGFLIAVVSAFGVAMKYAKLWEAQNVSSHSASFPNRKER